MRGTKIVVAGKEMRKLNESALIDALNNGRSEPLDAIQVDVEFDQFYADIAKIDRRLQAYDNLQTTLLNMLLELSSKRIEQRLSDNDTLSSAANRAGLLSYELDEEHSSLGAQVQEGTAKLPTLEDLQNLPTVKKLFALLKEVSVIEERIETQDEDSEGSFASFVAVAAYVDSDKPQKIIDKVNSFSITHPETKLSTSIAKAIAYYTDPEIFSDLYEV